MTEEELQGIETWFEAYTAPFLKNESIGFAVRLKHEHIGQVVVEMEALCRSIGLSDDDRRLALAIARLHDVGRFPQIARYGTMSDSRSENHATLALQVIEQADLLDNLPIREARTIRIAIANHNRPVLKADLDSRSVLFCRLIRDADKLDIWRVFLETDANGSQADKDTLFHDHPRTPKISEAILGPILNGKAAAYGDIKSRNDFRILTLSWVFDLNFPHSRKIVIERDYLGRMAANLPAGKDVVEALQALRAALEG